jgi:hypothetical protein
MRPIFKYVVKKSDPHFAKSSAGVQLLLSPFIGAVIVGVITWDQGFSGISIPLATAAGAGMGFIAGIFLVWNDSKKTWAVESGRPAPAWTKRRIVTTIVIVLVGFPLLLPIIFVVWDFLDRRR